MNDLASRILCVGNDEALLASRAAVLNHSGYQTDVALISDAPAIMRSSHYDLVIIAAYAPQTDKDLVTAAARPNVRFLEIERLIDPVKLLLSVREIMLTSPYSRAER